MSRSPAPPCNMRILLHPHAPKLTENLIGFCKDYFLWNFYATEPLVDRDDIENAIRLEPRSGMARRLLAAICAYVLLHPRLNLPSSQLEEILDGDTAFSRGHRILGELVQIRSTLDGSSLVPAAENPPTWTVALPALIAAAYSSSGDHGLAWKTLLEATNNAIFHRMYDEPAQGHHALLLLSLYVSERMYALRLLRSTLLTTRKNAILALTAKYPNIATEWGPAREEYPVYEKFLIMAGMVRCLEKQIVEQFRLDNVYEDWVLLNPDYTFDLHWRVHDHVTEIRCLQQWLRAIRCWLVCADNRMRPHQWRVWGNVTRAVLQDTRDIVEPLQSRQSAPFVDISVLCDIAEFGIDCVPVLDNTRYADSPPVLQYTEELVEITNNLHKLYGYSSVCYRKRLGEVRNCVLATREARGAEPAMQAHNDLNQVLGPLTSTTVVDDQCFGPAIITDHDKLE